MCFYHSGYTNMCILLEHLFFWKKTQNKYKINKVQHSSNHDMQAAQKKMRQ